ncbi:MAG: prephenate dehydrogenase/arogenate dehydrogenase family protein [Bacteroidetes bacterium]|nr:prephenate dehydrogenase/arogenate dehydrogenase family protein [Bacteroidota bacterium]
MRITVIGLGLMGSSMALDLKARGFCSHIIGVDINPEHCKEALARGIADEIQSPSSALPKGKGEYLNGQPQVALGGALNSDMIILAIPVNAIVKLLPGILDAIGENTVVMDIGSTKQDICKTIKKHPKRKQFVGTHPIAGTENSSPSSAMQLLFDNKIAILCVDDSALWVVERVSQLYEALNMKLVFMKAEEHDMHVAYVSHLSHLSSFSLAATVLEMEKNISAIFNLAGSGFESTVRLAKSSPDTWTPVFEQNSKHVSRALNTYIKHLTKFKNYIDKKNTKGIHAAIQKANAIRKILK